MCAECSSGSIEDLLLVSEDYVTGYSFCYLVVLFRDTALFVFFDSSLVPVSGFAGRCCFGICDQYFYQYLYRNSPYRNFGLHGSVRDHIGRDVPDFTRFYH